MAGWTACCCCGGVKPRLSLELGELLASMRCGSTPLSLGRGPLVGMSCCCCVVPSSSLLVVLGERRVNHILKPEALLGVECIRSCDLQQKIEACQL